MNELQSDANRLPGRLQGTVPSSVLFGTEAETGKTLSTVIIIVIINNYEARQAAITDGGLFTDTGVPERGENDQQSENDCEMKTVS